MRRLQTVRRLLLLGALAPMISFAWRVLAVTHVSSPAATSLASRDRESVAIGVVLNGQSRAYPLRMLGAEVLNDELGGAKTALVSPTYLPPRPSISRRTKRSSGWSSTGTQGRFPWPP